MGDRHRKIIPQLRRQIRDRDPHAVPIAGCVMKPFGRGEVETEAAGVTNGISLPAQIAAQGLGGLPCAGLIERATGPERNIEPVDEVEFGCERRKLARKQPGGLAAIAQDGCNALVG